MTTKSLFNLFFFFFLCGPSFDGLSLCITSIDYNYNIDVRQSLSLLTTFSFLHIQVQPSSPFHDYPSVFSDSSLHFRDLICEKFLTFTVSQKIEDYMGFEPRLPRRSANILPLDHKEKCLPNLTSWNLFFSFFPDLKNHPPFLLYLWSHCNPSAYGIRLANWRAR